jgi:glucoside 3-dehydrogenase (cytochrome c) hitch-hiker subunit
MADAEPLAFSRRAVVKTLGATLGAVAVWPYLSDSAAQAFAEIQATKAAPKLQFLTRAQYTTVDVLAETIIPADAHSPGARAARVADYIDLLLAESDDETREKWTTGLTALDEESAKRFKVPFAKATHAQAVVLLTDISRNEFAAETPLEKFFAMTKDSVVRGYYTSEIGIQKELTYKGNQYLGEFVGCTHPEHGFTDSKG